MLNESPVQWMQTEKMLTMDPLPFRARTKGQDTA
jgi:hypothetical protein